MKNAYVQFHFYPGTLPPTHVRAFSLKTRIPECERAFRRPAKHLLVCIPLKFVSYVSFVFILFMVFGLVFRHAFYFSKVISIHMSICTVHRCGYIHGESWVRLIVLLPLFPHCDFLRDRECASTLAVLASFVLHLRDVFQHAR